MSEAFFKNEQRVIQLQAEAAQWIGTQFVAHAKIKGAGVDCVHLCAEIYRECGVFQKYEFPRYTIDGGNHLQHSVVIEWIKKSGCFEPVVSPMRRQPGDLLCFQFGKVEHHTGIVISELNFIHCVKRMGTYLSSLNDPIYARRLTAIYRPVRSAMCPSGRTT